MTDTASSGDLNRRRLSRDECVDLLSRPLVGVFSSVAKGGWIHSVPVHFLYTGDGVRVLAGVTAVKTRNVQRSGHATLCVEVTTSDVRSFVSVSGHVRILRPPPTEDLVALDQRYSRTDFSSGWDANNLASAVMLVLRPDRWVAWADWD